MDLEQLDRGVKLSKRLEKLQRDLLNWERAYSIREVVGSVSVTGTTSLCVDYIDFKALKDQVIKEIKFKISAVEHEFYLL